MSTFWPAKTKEEFHRKGKQFARKLLKEMGIEGDVRSMYGGPAVMGEVVIHTDNFYVMFCGNGILQAHIMYRKCDGRKDYVGKGNNWLDYKDIDKLKQRLEEL